MSEVVICEPVRTPVGKFGGVLSSLSAVDLATSAIGGGQGLAAVFEAVQ